LLPLLLPPLPPLLLLLLQPPPPEEQLSPELMTALGMLWQLLCEGQALGLRLREAVEEKEEEGVAVEAEEAEAGGNQLLSLYNNSSPSQLPPTYESWEHSPESSKKKEIKQMPS